MMQPIERTMRTSGAFVRLQCLDVTRIFDLLGAIEAARVIGDRLLPFDGRARARARRGSPRGRPT